MDKPEPIGEVREEPRTLVSGIYLSKETLVEVSQWRKNGDHPEDACETFTAEDGVPFKGEGKVVRYFRHPGVKGDRQCALCGEIMHNHGWIDSGERGRIVCPGDIIVKTSEGHYVPYKPSAFEALYVPVK